MLAGTVSVEQAAALSAQCLGERGAGATLQAGFVQQQKREKSIAAVAYAGKLETLSLCTAHWDFDPSAFKNNRTLVIKKGDVMRLIKEVNEEWWMVELLHRSGKGLVPAQYLEVQTQPPPIQCSPPPQHLEEPITHVDAMGVLPLLAVVSQLPASE